jgi:DNA-binding NtrC family response regulator
MKTDPGLVVVSATEAFSEVWPQIAESHGLRLEVVNAPEPARDSLTVAVILACGGDEGHAVDLLHSAHRSGVTRAVVVGAETDHRLAVELMRRGAVAYYALPSDLDRLEEYVSQRAAALREAQAGEGISGTAERSSYDFSSMIGEDPSLKAALDIAARVIGGGRATVLITGETGTGKELLARAIHVNGPRAKEPFVPVNCSAIPSNLLESELFGHEKGAFTDARAAKPGLFEVADGGSLFLDEVATLPLELQAKLLRALEAREIRRVGGVRDIAVDVRIIAAANVDLARRVEQGDFRDDLFYRLAVIPIELPPLRSRGRDAVLLARHFLTEIAKSYGMEAPVLGPAAVAAIERHAWPGNVRELRNAIERALLLSGGTAIEPEHLALSAARRSPRAAAVQPGAELDLGFPATLDSLEKRAAVAMVELCRGNKSDAARRLGITRSRLYRILERAAGDDVADSA